MPKVADHDLMPYPASLPHDIIDRTIALLTGAPITKEDGHRLIHVIAYAYGQWDSGPHLVTEAPAAPMTKDQAVEALKSLKKPKHESVGAAPVGFNWLALIKILITVLLPLFGDDKKE